MPSTIAMFGFGEIGSSMALRLLAKGYTVNVWNRTPENISTMMDAGAINQESEVANIKSANIIVSVLPDVLSLQEILFHNDWAHELSGRTIIHFGSLNASRSQAFMDAFQAHQAEYVEVAAMGNREQVETGDWQLFVGADAENYEKVRQLLSDLSENVTFIGSVGEAVAIKLAMQQLMVANFCAFSSSIGLIKESGGKVELFMDFLRNSPVYAPMFDHWLELLLNRNYSQSSLPGRHIEQDLKLFLEHAEELGLTTHHVESVRELIGLSAARGIKDLGFEAVNDIINPPKE